MKRREFIEISTKAIVASTIFGSATLACSSTKNQKYNSLYSKSLESGKLSLIRGNMSRFNEKGGTIGVYEVKEGYILIDAQFPDTISHLLAAIQETHKPVLYLCNTHHHGDHTAGNIAFKNDNTTLVAQSKVPEYQKIRAIEKGNEDQQYYATKLFDTHFSLDLNGQKMKAYHYGNAHTFGDAIFHFESDNVVHMGDLIFNNLLPVYRVADGSDAENWANILGTIIQQFDSDTAFIFGHAKDTVNTQGGLEDLKNMKNFMEEVYAFGEKQFVSLGKSVEEVQNEFEYIPNFPNRLPIWKGHWQEFLNNLQQSFRA